MSPLRAVCLAFPLVLVATSASAQAAAPVGWSLRPATAERPAPSKRSQPEFRYMARNRRGRSRSQIEVVLTGMADPPDPQDRLFIGKAFHKAFIRVDEKGTPGGRRDGGHHGFGHQPRAKVRRAGRVADPSAT
jgi:hypothetical protein